MLFGCVSRKTLSLLASSAACALLASPVLAQEAEPSEAEASPGIELPATFDLAGLQVDDRLVASSLGLIRPFGGGILPYAGNIRTFAGPVSGSAGNIRTFSGDANASAGNIRTFAGNIRTFAGNIRTFQSLTVPSTGPDANFWGGFYPASNTLTASAGNIRTFAGEYEGMAGNIRTFAGNIRTFSGDLLGWQDGASTYTSLGEQIGALVTRSKSMWGAAVTAQTGKTFEAGFSDRMLGKYGINLNDARSLVGMDEVGVELFLMDWYDNLMNFSGADQVDHWMSAVNWSPRITQDLGSGKDSRIGLLDFTVTGEGTSSLVKSSGVSNVAGIHGSAVLSLMTAAHDGRGVMGIAPGASVVSFNPFDETYTAGWTDIRAGVLNLVKNGATIVNMSLGVPGWTLNAGWNTVFSDDAVSKEAKKRIFVLAAGNDGITQTQHVQWAFDKNPSIIVVGSVDPSGNISEFSNRPGDVCLTKDGKLGKNGGCSDKDRATLASRFIVAPGEFILVSDGQGGVTRMSGTSFAAPLVSGTVALIHDRWPWLRDRPNDTAELILSSARDLGAPGIDAVYGRGELDVTAALSPQSLDALRYKISINGGGLTDVKATVLTADQRASMLTYWEATNAYVSAFDDTLTSYRDFLIPLSSRLAGQTAGTSQQQFASYLTSRFFDWFSSGGTVSTKGKFAPAFTGDRYAAPLSLGGAMELTMSAAPRAYRAGIRQNGSPFETGIALRNVEQGYGFRAGTGRSGAALGQLGFGMQSDYDPVTGGANPYLGFASGDGYAAVELSPAAGLTISSGFSQQNAQRDLRDLTINQQAALSQASRYQASATNVTVQYRATPWLTTSFGYTLLNETDAVLGTQSVIDGDLGDGSRTDAGTIGAQIELSPTLAISTSASLGRTRSGDVSRQALAVGAGGLLSSSYQAAVTKLGLIGNDRMRLTLSQPMHVEHGSIDVSNVQVIDRQTGELGTVVQSFELQGRPRRLVSELLYGRPVLDGTGEINLFGRMNLKGDVNTGESTFMAGSSLRLNF